MELLSLTHLSANAFRVLGLTAAASQAQIDAAARRMRIWPNSAKVPPTANDAAWIGPIIRSKSTIEHAVAALADPAARVEARLWWFCATPPASDALRDPDPREIAAFHDAALVHLYHGLLGGSDADAWPAIIARFKKLAQSDDYLQWMMEAESAGEFEKRATLDEIGLAQAHMTARLMTVFSGSAQDALSAGDFSAAARAVDLIRAQPASVSTAAADPVLDRMQEDLIRRCAELTERVNTAWETKLVSKLRPACNHAVARFGTHIEPLIRQIEAATVDPMRQEQAKSEGVRLLVHVSDGYAAIDNHLAVERTLQAAADLAAGTAMEDRINDLLENAQPAIGRQRAGAAFGQRQVAPYAKPFQIKPGGPIRGDPWWSEIPYRWIAIGLAMMLGLARFGCSARSKPEPSAQFQFPVYNSKNPPPGVER